MTCDRWLPYRVAIKVKYASTFICVPIPYCLLRAFFNLGRRTSKWRKKTGIMTCDAILFFIDRFCVLLSTIFFNIGHKMHVGCLL
jgi:hypothetical protein